MDMDAQDQVQLDIDPRKSDKPKAEPATALWFSLILKARDEDDGAAYGTPRPADISTVRSSCMYIRISLVI